MKVNGSTTVGATKKTMDNKSDVSVTKGTEKNVGDIANQVAGNKAAASGRVVEGHGNPKLDKDAFFKLMLAQFKNQDPTNPLKEHEMAAQLAQFSSLEQMSNVKDILSEMSKNQTQGDQYQTLDMIGKFVSGDSSKIDRTKGQTTSDVSFNLSDAADVVQISIKDSNGKTVKEVELSQQSKGFNNYKWDGIDKDGKAVVPGVYKATVQAASKQNGKINVDQKFKGAVTGVQFSEKGPILQVGHRMIPLKEVKMIEMGNSEGSSVGTMMAGKGQMVPAQGATAHLRTEDQKSASAIMTPKMNDFELENLVRNKIKKDS